MSCDFNHKKKKAVDDTARLIKYAFMSKLFLSICKHTIKCILLDEQFSVKLDFSNNCIV